LPLLGEGKLKKIIVLGSVNIDLVVHVSQFPKPGETLLGSDFEQTMGGKGANQAVAAARMGAQVVMIGRVGKDSYGRAALKNLQDQNVDISHLSVDQLTPSGMAFILVNQNGDNTIIVSPGANGKVQEDDLNRAANLFTPDSILMCQLEISPAIVKAGMRLAKKRDASIILNPSPASRADAEILREADTLVLNETELFALSHCSVIQDGLRNLQQMGIKQIALTLGSQGCILLAGDWQKSIPAYSVNVVDTTGAGDAFMGAFSTALACGYDFFTAGQWGNAAGALATTSVGAQTSLPDRIQMEALLSGDRAVSALRREIK
jgi:ribokinase